MASPIVAEEYSEDSPPQYMPMAWSLKEIRDTIPAQFFVKDTRRGLFYFLRDVFMAITAWWLAATIDPSFQRDATYMWLCSPTSAEIVRWAAWCVYWWFQGLIFTGIWAIGHECGHGNLSEYKTVNDVVGFISHTFLGTPYFSFKISHHRHHTGHGSMEHDEAYIPNTRKDLGIPDKPNNQIEWNEIFADSPIYTLIILLRQQLLGYPAYFFFNVTGRKTYPKWTSHFDPSSVIFTETQHNAVVFSNIGILIMVFSITYAGSVYGSSEVIKYYGIPLLLFNHWFILITYLQHTDFVLPRYRAKGWNFPRGAASTVDRDILGWQGRFFFHNMAHYHVIHHFFPKMPFYYGHEATQYLKDFIGDYYTFSDKPAFKALWETFNRCQFVENDGDVLFFRDKKGQAMFRPSDAYRVTKKNQ